MKTNLVGNSNEAPLPTQQDLEKYLGGDRSLTSCAPTAFFIAANLRGIKICDLSEYAEKVKASDAYDPKVGWNRPAFSQDFRKWFGVHIVSWQTNQNSPTNYEASKSAGYFVEPKEIEFFKNFVDQKSIENTIETIIKKLSIPLIVTVAPGFGKNTQAHTVVVQSIDGSLNVIDPDNRNESKVYTTQELIKHLEPNGAMSVVFAK